MPYTSSCTDCASLTDSFDNEDRIVRGGSVDAVNDGDAPHGYKR